MTEIQLGDKVRCIHSGFVGIAVAKTEFVNGCIQFDIMPKVDKKNEMPLGMAVDSESLEVITPKKKPQPKPKQESNGGPMRRGLRRRAF